MVDPLEILLGIAKEKTKLGKWDDQPLQLVKVMPNSTKGDLGELFIARYAKALNLDVLDKKSRLGDWDVTIGGKNFEVKMATEDINGCFQFNHIRYDYKYDYLLCLGIAPAEILFEIYSKAQVATGQAGSMVTMGRGQNSSFKLTKRKNALLSINAFENKLKALP